MPLFFLLSGFFAVLVIEKRGVSYFVKDRIFRIGVTCFLFCALYDLLDGRFDFTLGHLWFLYKLLVFVLCFSLLYKFKQFKNLVNQKISPNTFPIIAIWLIATVPLAYMLNDTLNPDAIAPPETYFSFKLGNSIYYFSYFLLGVLLYSNQKIFKKLSDHKTIIILGALSVFSYFIQLYADSLLYSDVEDIRHAIEMTFDPIEVLINAVIIGINSLLWCVFFIGLATKFFQSGHAVLTWFVELSYPVYLIHVLPVVIISAILYRAGLNQFSIFIVTIITGFIISVGLYYIFFRFTPLNWLMIGYQKAFAKHQKDEQL